MVLTALNLKKVLEYVGDTGRHDLVDPLEGVGLLALVGVVGPQLPALATLALVAGVLVVLVAFETVTYAEHRRELRAR